MALTVGSLFSGIGGIDLGLERAGMVTRWFVEVDPHCRNVLARHWPGLPIYGDIAAIDWSGVEPVDVLAGGFPCQPASSAGRQLAQDDERWLWPEFARAIRELRPRYVLVENVRNLLAVNGGSAFAEVLGDLAACGFAAEWDCIPASAAGAPHQRDRLWLVAYAEGERLPAGPRDARSPSPSLEPERSGDVAYPESVGGRRRRSGSVGQRTDAAGRGASGGARSTLADATEIGRRAAERDVPTRQPDAAGARPTDPDVLGERLEGVLSRWAAARAVDGSRDGSHPAWWATEPDVGRVAHGVPHRVDRLRALGNAVVPQVVEWIGRAVGDFDEARKVSA